MSAVLRVGRLLAVSYWLHLKMIAVSVFEGVFQVVWPLYFATVAFLLYGRADDESVQWNPEADAWLDVAEFERLSAAPESR